MAALRLLEAEEAAAVAKKKRLPVLEEAAEVSPAAWKKLRKVALPTGQQLLSDLTSMRFKPIPKGEPAKPGKRTPTKDEKAWMDAVRAYGCIACHIDGVLPRPTAIHHLLRGGQRMGHKHTIGLCDPGHHQGGKLLKLVSRHPDKAAFEKKYGTEAQLLKRTQKTLKKQSDGSYAP